MFDVSGARLRLRLHPGPPGAPTVLLFHGNGETARDYDEAAEAFRALPAALAVADYRGYGPATGTPSFLTFLDDAHATLDELARLRREEGGAGPIVVMGRSLGSAPAIELAAERGGEVAGLVVESGFSRVVPLLELLGMPASALGVREEHGPENLRKMGDVACPTLVMHAENDEIIPFWQGRELHAGAGDPGAAFLAVPAAGHNDIQLRAGASYFEAIGALLGRVVAV